MQREPIAAILLIAAFFVAFIPTKAQKVHQALSHKKTLYGEIRPKSIVHSGKGLFFAQNMMYKHTITVYDRDFKLISTISDRIRFGDYGISGYSGSHQGSPVEAAFSHGGKFAWVSNYEMFGRGFKNPGKDKCKKSKNYDNGFVYKINTETLEIESLVEVGCIPKYLALTRDQKYLMVTNWCSGDLSIVDTKSNKEVDRVDLGAYPRGIACDSESRYVYITIMGGSKLAVLDLWDFSVTYRNSIGKTPRHICLSPDDQYAYITLSRDGKVVKIRLSDFGIEKGVTTGKQPRSMAISPDGAYLYVVNYESNTLSKIETGEMKLVSKKKTNLKPIGVTVDAEAKTVWVACYTGSIMIFNDPDLKAIKKPEPLLASDPDRDSLSTAIGFIKLAAAKFTGAQAGIPFHPDYRPAPQASPPPVEKVNIAAVSMPEPLPQPRWEDQKIVRVEPKTRKIQVDSSTITPSAQITKKESTPKEKRISPYYAVIVGSFASKANANASIKKFTSKGLKTRLINKSGGGFRIAYGNYGNKNAAVLATKLLKETYMIEGWVLKVKN